MVVDQPDWTKGIGQRQQVLYTFRSTAYNVPVGPIPNWCAALGIAIVMGSSANITVSISGGTTTTLYEQFQTSDGGFYQIPYSAAADPTATISAYGLGNGSIVTIIGLPQSTIPLLGSSIIQAAVPVYLVNFGSNAGLVYVEGAVGGHPVETLSVGGGTEVSVQGNPNTWTQLLPAAGSGNIYRLHSWAVWQVGAPSGGYEQYILGNGASSWWSIVSNVANPSAVLNGLLVKGPVYGYDMSGHVITYTLRYDIITTPPIP